jgi:DNA-binding FrmR family transcriptional regulator
MNRLEKYISDHKNQFDEEPSTGHFERMQQKMNRKSGQISRIRWSISIAASIAVLLLAATMWQHKGKQDDRTVVCENSIDMKTCYINRMNTVAGQIEILSKNLDSWDRQQVMTDVQDIIDAAGSGFESEIPKELPEHEAKTILSDYYRQNLESLETIAKELRNKNYEL